MLWKQQTESITFLFHCSVGPRVPRRCPRAAFLGCTAAAGGFWHFVELWVLLMAAQSPCFNPDTALTNLTLSKMSSFDPLQTEPLAPCSFCPITRNPHPVEDTSRKANLFSRPFVFLLISHFSFQGFLKRQKLSLHWKCPGKPHSSGGQPGQGGSRSSPTSLGWEGIHLWKPCS